MQVTFAPRILVISPICNGWSLTYLGMMLLICAPLSKRAIQLSPLILTLATFNPMPMLKGVWIQVGSLLGWLYTLGTSVCTFFSMVAVVGWVQASFFDAIPSLPFNCSLSLKDFMSRQLQIKCSGILQW